MFTVADRVQETTNSPGTGTATLLGAVSGYQSFSTGIGINNTTYYVIADQLGTNWEVGLGALNSTGTVLTRTTVYSSSNGGSTVNFATGLQYVWCDFPASKALTTFSAGTTGLTPNTATSGAITLAGTLGTANGGTNLTSFTSGGAVYATSTSALTTGTLPIVSGGTNSTATPTAGGAGYGTGTAHAYTAAGTSGQALISAGAAAPAFGNLALGVANTNVSGALTPTNGGTGVATLTGIAYGNGTSAFTAASTAQVLSVIGTLPVSNGGTGQTTSTGTGSVVLSTSPTLVTPTINQINTSVSGVSLGAGNASIMKNRIINGAMVIDQRNAGASITNIVGAAYSVDRMSLYGTIASKYTGQQNAGAVTSPVGFSNYLGITSSSAYSVLAGDYFMIQHSIEGLNSYDLNWGTANAKTVTLSFWAYSSLTGTFGGTLRAYNGSYSYPFSYSLPVANTWTQISVTITGATTGTFTATNGGNICVCFGLGVGSSFSGTAGSWSANTYFSATGATSVVGTSGATFYITGVQLEVGSSATGFEYRQYGQELALCQRYLPISNSQSTASQIAFGYNYGTTNAQVLYLFKVTPRIAPTGISTTPSQISLRNSGATPIAATGAVFAGSSLEGVMMNITGVSGLVTGGGTICEFNNASGQIQFTGCEL